VDYISGRGDASINGAKSRSQLLDDPTAGIVVPTLEGLMETRCCIAGGGPAGMMLGLLLARAGIEVVVLEKHADFLRDFRGDTIHPSTLEIMHRLGLLDNFLERPHQEVRTISAEIGNETVRVADFSHLPTRCRFIALMPQWEFLDFLADEARLHPGFTLLMQAEATDLIPDGERICGVVAETPDGRIEIRADLIVGADGRRSTIRQKAGMKVLDIGAPMDVLWMAIPRQEDDPDQTFGRIDAGRMMVMINRDSYWQCAYVIPKGALDKLKAAGLDAFRAGLLSAAPYLGKRVEAIASWDDVKLLTVAVDRLEKWHLEGLLCIGDAAHAMSPIGGVGINLAIQDAVATANILTDHLRGGAAVPESALAEVQQRRTMPTRLTQTLQVFLQKRFISAVLTSTAPLRVPWPLRLMQRFPILQRIPARLIGIGVRPEYPRPDPARPGG